MHISEIITHHFTRARHEGLVFFRDHPNETGRDVVAGAVIGTLKGFGLIEAHAETPVHESLIDTPFTLTGKGVEVCENWEVSHSAARPEME